MADEMRYANDADKDALTAAYLRSAPTTTSVTLDLEEVIAIRLALADAASMNMLVISSFDAYKYLDHKVARAQTRLEERKQAREG